MSSGIGADTVAGTAAGERLPAVALPAGSAAAGPERCVFPTREAVRRPWRRACGTAASRCAPTSAPSTTWPTRVGACPRASAAERFEVVVNLLSLSQVRRVRLGCRYPPSTPRLPTLFDLYPGVEAMEREAYDLFGIVFVGHPDMTRILLPEDWEGHPLRKDYGVGPGAGPVQGRTGSAMSDSSGPHRADTAEPARPGLR